MFVISPLQGEGGDLLLNQGRCPGFAIADFQSAEFGIPEIMAIFSGRCIGLKPRAVSPDQKHGTPFSTPELEITVVAQAESLTYHNLGHRPMGVTTKQQAEKSAIESKT